tara:strand:+ start:1557 stop:1733 length:177 start_codon:yes stop_codon:yes gene_type:complete
MPKQYNSEIEKELHLTRLSIERIEKQLRSFELYLKEVGLNQREMMEFGVTLREGEKNA